MRLPVYAAPPGRDAADGGCQKAPVYSGAPDAGLGVGNHRFCGEQHAFGCFSRLYYLAVVPGPLDLLRR